MTQPISSELLNALNLYGRYLAFVVAGAGVLILLGHFIKLMMTKDFKTRYDYINMHEINLMWYGILLIIIGLAMFGNSIAGTTTWLWLSIRLFVSIMLAMIVGVVVQNVLKFYYPFYIEKRLKRLRYTPRVSPDGRKMKLLSEEEEDVYLDEGMQAEEEVFSIDYGVWVDEETGYTKIEKYSGHLHAQKCPECNYQTLRVVKEEIVTKPPYDEEGELIKYFSCSYCDYSAQDTFKVAKLKGEEEAAATA